MDGPDSQADLLRFLSVFSRNTIPVTNLRFLINDLDWGIFDGFCSSTLVEIFSNLPHLEVLCVDQYHDRETPYQVGIPWPGRWVSWDSIISSGMADAASIGGLCRCFHACKASTDIDHDRW